MTDKKQIEAMAVLEYGKENIKRIEFDDWNEVWQVTSIKGFTRDSDYPNDHNARIRVISTLRLSQIRKVKKELKAVIERDNCKPYISGQDVIATGKQWVEAILKATGKWEDQ